MMVINEHFAVRIPETLPLDRVAPLMCAGITMYTPMRRHGLDKPGLHLGVLGLGGLGHLAVKFAKSFGMKVTVISGPGKEKDAIEGLGADSFIVSSDEEQMKVPLFNFYKLMEKGNFICICIGFVGCSGQYGWYPLHELWCSFFKTFGGFTESLWQTDFAGSTEQSTRAADIRFNFR